MAATPLVRDVILRDGSVLRLRSPRPEDEPAIKAFFDALAPESRYMRFHGAGRTDIVARDYAHADGDRRVALLAHLGDRIVAVAGYDRLNEPGAAEVAFALRFALLLEHVPEIGEVDLNPVRVMAGGAAVLDARVRVAPRPEPRRAKTW